MLSNNNNYNNNNNKIIQELHHNNHNIIENEHYINKYLLGQKIGEGKESIIKKCYDTINNNSYVIKIIQLNQNNHENYHKIENEINILSIFKNHRNIITLHDYFYGINHAYIITNKSQTDLVSKSYFISYYFYISF